MIQPEISVIIPVHNGGSLFDQCLFALRQSLYQSWECIVVEDGSTDNTVEIAYAHSQASEVEHPIRLVSGLKRRLGPAQARNIGARLARGEILFFLDADVLVQPGTVGHVVATLQADPDLMACFGSYDDKPQATNFLSQYRNLLHHYVHQQGNIEAFTFWSGCGAIRRDIFLAVGGFNEERYERPSIEDIELGYRLHAAGYRVQLEKLLQVKHMKRWTARQMLITDVRDRALPWTELILEGGALPNDLNLSLLQRISTAAAFVGLLGLGLALFSNLAWLLVLLAVGLLIRLNRDFYQFLWEKRGLRFTLTVLPWHWLYFIYSGTAFLAGFTLFRMGWMERFAASRLRPITVSKTVSKPRASIE